MKTRLLPSLGLLAILLAACAPPASPVATAPPVVVASSSTPVPTQNTSIQPTVGPTEAFVPTALPVATSRGPNLEATDPNTVNLASGQLQLVEFFRFT